MIWHPGMRCGIIFCDLEYRLGYLISCASVCLFLIFCILACALPHLTLLTGAMLAKSLQSRAYRENVDFAPKWNKRCMSCDIYSFTAPFLGMIAFEFVPYAGESKKPGTPAGLLSLCYCRPRQQIKSKHFRYSAWAGSIAW